MSVNYTFGGTIVDENEIPLSGVKIQAFYQKNDGTNTLWDSSIRISDSNGKYVFNMGDDTFITNDNIVSTDGSDGKIYINAWTSNNREDLLDLFGTVIVPLDGSNVYITDIQILSPDSLTSDEWIVTDSAYVNEVLSMHSDNTNESLYQYKGNTIYQHKEIDNVTIFPKLGIETSSFIIDNVSYNGIDFDYIFSTAGNKVITNTVTDYYGNTVSYSKIVKIYTNILYDLVWFPLEPILNEVTTFTTTATLDTDSIVGIRIINNGTVIHSSSDFNTSFVYSPTDIVSSTLTHEVTYFDGFTNQIISKTYNFNKTNQAPIVDLVTTKPIADDKYSFAHNSYDIDGEVVGIQWIIELNAKDKYNNENWTPYYDTGVLTDFSDFVYDFAGEPGEYRISAIAHDNLGLTGSGSFIADIRCQGFDISNVDWTKNITVTKFSKNKIKKSFNIKINKINFINKNIKKVQWNTNTKVIDFSVNTKKILFKTK